MGADGVRGGWVGWGGRPEGAASSRPGVTTRQIKRALLLRQTRPLPHPCAAAGPPALPARSGSRRQRRPRALRRRAPLTLVRVVLECELAVRLLDLLCRGCHLDAQDLVIARGVPALGRRAHAWHVTEAPAKGESTKHGVLVCLCTPRRRGWPGRGGRPALRRSGAVWGLLGRLMQGVSDLNPGVGVGKPRSGARLEGKGVSRAFPHSLVCYAAGVAARSKGECFGLGAAPCMHAFKGLVLWLPARMLRARSRGDCGARKWRENIAIGPYDVSKQSLSCPVTRQIAPLKSPAAQSRAGQRASARRRPRSTPLDTGRRTWPNTLSSEQRTGWRRAARGCPSVARAAPGGGRAPPRLQRSS
jgi:hypothetical protein